MSQTSQTQVIQSDKRQSVYLSLRSRYQESLTPEVAKRLQEITVDPKTVKLVTNPSDE